MVLYPGDLLSRFEFDKIREKIAEYCRSDAAKAMAMKLEPVVQMDIINKWLDQTSEFLEIRQNGMFFPETSFPTISRELNLLSISGSVLEGEQIAKLRAVAEIANNVIRFLSEKKVVYPALFTLTENLEKSKGLVDLVDSVIELNGMVKSSASKELNSIRKELTARKQRAARAFESAVRKYKNLGWLREFDESYYNDRRVLAVVSEQKRQVEGIIHGMSETGSTAFIEPASMVVLNNDVFETRQQETREVYRILTVLTEQLRTWLPVLQSYEQALALLDFTQAKASFAYQLNCSKPVLKSEKVINLLNAYHPLLLLQNKKEEKSTIPLNLYIDHRQRIIIISGPNAGGKSISLKTLGLLQIMMQSGLLIPADGHSEMTVFKQLFVDIGDDQSIAYELSTYSSRLIKMKHFLFHANKNTIFFIDEFGTGSDPELGGAIAETILEELVKTKAYGMITTHYGNIKILAEQTPGLLNGCMLFDEKTLHPQYKLHLGHPGSSYTFEVATKIGLSPDIIESSKQKLDQRKVNLDKLLVTLQTKKNELNKEKHNLQVERSKLSKEMESYSLETDKYKERQKELEYEDNKKLIERGKKYNQLLEYWQKEKNRKELLKKIIVASEKERARELETDQKEKLRLKQERIAKQKQSRRNDQKIQKEKETIPVKVGDTVRLKNSKQRGSVEDINKNKATVVFGMIKTIVSVKDLVIV